MYFHQRNSNFNKVTKQANVLVESTLELPLDKVTFVLLRTLIDEINLDLSTNSILRITMSTHGRLTDKRC